MSDLSSIHSTHFDFFVLQSVMALDHSAVNSRFACHGYAASHLVKGYLRMRAVIAHIVAQNKSELNLVKFTLCRIRLVESLARRHQFTLLHITK